MLDAILPRLRDGYVRILGDNLAGLYVHGSIAFGCFHWEQSDIDLIALARRPMAREEKLRLLAFLDGLAPEAPKKGIEMSVVLLETARYFVYPTPFELHYSPDWAERYRLDPLSLCADGAKTDPDLAAHFTVIRRCGIALAGLPVPEAFGEVPRADYVDSIVADIAQAREEVRKNPVYIVLNLCRVAAFLEGGGVVSKQQGGEWGLAHLPERFVGVIAEALERYAADGGAVDGAAAENFCDYMLGRIQDKGANASPDA